MKKNVLFVSLLLLFPMIGCNNLSSQNVKINIDEYTFGEELSSYDKIALIKDIKANMSNANSVSIESEQYQYAKHQSTRIKTTGSQYAYSNNFLYAETSTTTEKYDSGITTKETQNQKKYRFLDMNSRSKIEYTSINDEKVEYLITKFEVSEKETIVESLYKDAEEDALLDLENLTARKDGSGYVFYSSSVNETHTAQQWGSETKEKITVEESQTVVKVNSNKRVTSQKIYLSSSSNVDSSTNECLGEVKTISSSSISYTVNYGERSKNTNNESIKEKFTDLFFVGADLSIQYYDIEDLDNPIGNMPLSNLSVTRASPTEWTFKAIVSLNDNYEDKAFVPNLHTTTYASLYSKETVGSDVKLRLNADDTIISYKNSTYYISVIPTETAGKKLFIEFTAKLGNVGLNVASSNMTIA